jgi:hypothetical protein
MVFLRYEPNFSFLGRATATPNDFSLRDEANGETNFGLDVTEKKGNRVVRFL